MGLFMRQQSRNSTFGLTFAMSVLLFRYSVYAYSIDIQQFGGDAKVTIFKLDTRKAIEASATLLRQHPGRLMDRKRLLALLYLVDRESLKRTARPVIGGKISAMKFGPIHSEVYNLITGGGDEQASWSRHFENDGYRIRLSDDGLSVSALSRYEIDLLNEISTKYAGFGTWDVAEETHTDEYIKNYQQGTPTPIPLEDQIEAVGRNLDKSVILQDAAEKALIDKMFAAGNK
jgi:uncharacterized phage-associated protein